MVLRPGPLLSPELAPGERTTVRRSTRTAAPARRIFPVCTRAANTARRVVVTGTCPPGAMEATVGRGTRSTAPARRVFPVGARTTTPARRIAITVARQRWRCRQRRDREGCQCQGFEFHREHQGSPRLPGTGHPDLALTYVRFASDIPGEIPSELSWTEPASDAQNYGPP